LIWFYKPEIEKIKPNPNKKKLKKNRATPKPNPLEIIKITPKII